MRSAVLLIAAAAWAQTLSPSDLNRVAVGAIAPDFELQSANGGNVRLSGLRGKHVVLVFYRGYW